MTRVLIAFDKFKDALSSGRACEAAAEALRAKHPDWTLDLCPLTDGGEGFAETLTRAARGELHPVRCQSPLGEPVAAHYGLVKADELADDIRHRLKLSLSSTLAIVDMATASGLALVPAGQRDPWATTTFGTGELLQVAGASGPDAILLGVGGSATNDLGLGALAALGFEFLDAAGTTITPPLPRHWEQIVEIRAHSANLPPLFIACDVTNPLLGPRGATAVFGPQKGLAADEVARFESLAARQAALLAAACAVPPELASAPGAGAAGGLTYGLMAGCGARVVPGFDVVSDWLDLPARLLAAHLVITGEGRFDATSLEGKGPGSLITAATQLRKRVHVFAGSTDFPTNDPTLRGAVVHVISPAGLPLAEALAQTATNLAATVTAAL